MTQFGRVPQTSFANVDGRMNAPILGAMGSDSGEFIVALSAFESTSGIELSSFQVSSLLTDFLLQSDKPTFIFQTDAQALGRLCASHRLCPPQTLDRVPSSMQTDILDALTRAENHGCSHFKHLVTSPETFGVRATLVHHFLAAFFRLLWGSNENPLDLHAYIRVKSKLRLMVLQGSHTEGALLNIYTSSCSPELIPMLVPEISSWTSSVMMHHVDAAVLLRRYFAGFLVSEAKKMNLQSSEVMDTELLLVRMNALADQQYKAALAIDSGKTPVYALHYPGVCCGSHG